MASCRRASAVAPVEVAPAAEEEEVQEVPASAKRSKSRRNSSVAPSEAAKAVFEFGAAACNFGFKVCASGIWHECGTWHVSRGTNHGTCGTWHVACGMWYVAYEYSEQVV